jgi:hypothetical protein
MPKSTFKKEDRNNMRDEEIYRDNWELKIFESAEWLIAPSAFLAERFFKLYPKIYHKRLIIVPYGIDHKIFKPRH